MADLTVGQMAGWLAALPVAPRVALSADALVVPRVASQAALKAGMKGDSRAAPRAAHSVVAMAGRSDA